MNYRYFYTDTGEIVGYSRYKHVCFSLGMNDSTGYIDTDQEVDIAQYRIDLENLTLVPITTE
jgi:hypothetical protein